MGEEDGHLVMIEDVTDPDGRMYRLEYRASHDGLRAVAYCLYNPWGGPGNPNAGEDYLVGHARDDGFLCVGKESVDKLDESPYDLDHVIQRARYWCTAFSVLKETGVFPHP